MPEAFDKAWKQIKETLHFVPTEQWETKKGDIDDLNDALSHRDKKGNYDKLGHALSRARRQKRKPLPKNLGGMVRTEGKPIDPFGGSGSFKTDKHGGPQADCKICEGKGTITIPAGLDQFGNPKTEEFRCESCPKYSWEK